MDKNSFLRRPTYIDFRGPHFSMLPLIIYEHFFPRKDQVNIHIIIALPHSHLHTHRRHFLIIRNVLIMCSRLCSSYQSERHDHLGLINKIDRTYRKWLCRLLHMYVFERVFLNQQRIASKIPETFRIARIKLYSNTYV